jgi:CheY-like chemotaxis protein
LKTTRFSPRSRRRCGRGPRFSAQRGHHVRQTLKRHARSVRRQLGQRRHCLIVADHLGTAGTLRLVLDRFVSTEGVTDGIDALYRLSWAVPDCVVCDDGAWAAAGASFVRTLRTQHPSSRIIRLITEVASAKSTADAAPLIDAIVREERGLKKVVRTTLASRPQEGRDCGRPHHARGDLLSLGAQPDLPRSRRRLLRSPARRAR